MPDLVIETEFAPAVQDIPTESYVVEKGQTAGIRLRLVGMIGDRRAATLENTWFLGKQNVSPDWLGPSRETG